jgi:uncharacterized protein YbjT (DUF2867 family)
VILVTGATGKVGQEVVLQLSAANVPVRAFVRDPERASAVRLPGVEIAVGDFALPESLDRALRGIDRIFLVSSADPDQVALQGNVVQAAKRAGVAHIVKVSVAGGPDAATQIGRWHWTTEKQIEAAGLNFTMLRPALYMQQTLTFAPSIAATGSFSLPAGTGEVSFIDTRDVASVAVRALTEGGHDRRIYDLTGPEALSFDAVADQIAQAIGKPVSYVHVPPEYAKKQMLSSGVPRWLVDDMLILFASFREGYGAAVSDTIERVTKQRPRTFRQFARDYARVFLEGR